MKYKIVYDTAQLVKWWIIYKRNSLSIRTHYRYIPWMSGISQISGCNSADVLSLKENVSKMFILTKINPF